MPGPGMNSGSTSRSRRGARASSSASESVAGKGEASIFAMVDELTRRVKADFKLSPQDIASDIDKDVGITHRRNCPKPTNITSRGSGTTSRANTAKSLNPWKRR